MILWRLVTRSLGVISTLVLAHVLVPQDFGVVAIATTYVAAFDAISTVGLQEAIIKTSGSGEQLHNTAFTLEILRGVMNGIIVAASAPLAASFFSEPRIAAVLYVLAALAVFEGFENIGVVEFRRDLRFDKDFQLFLVPQLISVVVTISCSLAFRSYWALVCGIATLRLARLAATYILHPYRPGFSLAEWRQISAFSFWTWAASIASFTRDRSWTIVVGRFFDPASVGSFTMASEIGLLPVSEFINPICRALFAGFALARHQGTSLGPAFVRTIGVVAIVVLPAAIGISAVGNYIVTIALGSKWINAVAIMQIISAAAPFSILTAIGGTVMNASGHIRRNFWIVTISSIFGVAGSALMAEHFGMIGVGVATGLVMMLEGLLFLLATARSLGVSAGDIMYRLWRPLAAAAVMAVVLWVAGYGWHTSSASTIDNFWNCGIAIAIGALSYGTSLGILWKLSNDPDPLELFLVDIARKSLP